MSVYSISYDLLTPGKQYTELHNLLQRLGGLRILLSEWLVRSPLTATDLRDKVLREGGLDGNDRLFVARLAGEAAWNNLLVSNQAAANRINDLA